MPKTVSPTKLGAAPKLIIAMQILNPSRFICVKIGSFPVEPRLNVPESSGKSLYKLKFFNIHGSIVQKQWIMHRHFHPVIASYNGIYHEVMFVAKKVNIRSQKLDTPCQMLRNPSIRLYFLMPQLEFRCMRITDAVTRRERYSFQQQTTLSCDTHA